MLESSVDAIIVINDRGEIIEWNPQSQAMFGWSREEAIGRLIHETVIPQRLRNKHLHGVERYLVTGESHVEEKRLEVLGVRRNGDEFAAELTVTMHEQAQNRCFSAFVRDLTRTKETERRLHEQEQQVAHVTRLSTLNELAAGIAHELNQPLTAIAGLASMSSVINDVQELHEMMTQIEEFTLQAGQLVNGFRKLASKSHNSFVTCDLNELIVDAVGLLDNQLRHSLIDINVDLKQSLAPIWADEIQIQQVLINLIKNAIDAVEQESEKSIQIQTFAEGEENWILVRNSGPKLTDQHAFNAFHTSKENGLGLGLTISQTIVEHHGGRIWQDQEEPRTCFCIALPKK